MLSEQQIQKITDNWSSTAHPTGYLIMSLVGDICQMRAALEKLASQAEILMGYLHDDDEWEKSIIQDMLKIARLEEAQDEGNG